MVIIYILLTRYAFTLKKRIVNTMMRTLPDLIVGMLEPPPSAPASQQEPLLELIH
jgi:hypothetical protein